jgi:dTDP-4-dehydrorhamnose reductase
MTGGGFLGELMRALILGGEGMLGHQLFQELAPSHDTVVTLRQPAGHYRNHRLFAKANAIHSVDAQNAGQLRKIITDARPDVVVNAIGIVKQRQDSEDAVQAIEINALLPHRLAEFCSATSARLIHISTDCVFSGARGHYREDDVADATDLYGRTKLLGEVTGPRCLTLRTSIVGLELKRHKSLVEWFLAQTGSIRGFRRAIYSGLTTPELGRVIRRLSENFAHLNGLFHVVSKPISKYDMLCQLSDLLDRRDITIEPDDSFVCDRSMNGERFKAATGYVAPPWSALLEELARKIKERSAR